jgi:hypothetical protein
MQQPTEQNNRTTEEPTVSAILDREVRRGTERLIKSAVSIIIAGICAAAYEITKIIIGKRD